MPTSTAVNNPTAASQPQALSFHAQSLQAANDGAITSRGYLFSSGAYSLVAMPDPLRPDTLNVQIAKNEFGPSSAGDIAKLTVASPIFCRAIEERYPQLTVRNIARGDAPEILNRVPFSVGTGNIGFEQPWARSGAYRLAAAIDERDVEHPRIAVVIVHSNPHSTEGDVALLKQYSGEAVRFLRSLHPHHEISNLCDQMFPPIYDRSAWGNKVR